MGFLCVLFTEILDLDPQLSQNVLLKGCKVEINWKHTACLSAPVHLGSL